MLIILTDYCTMAMFSWLCCKQKPESRTILEDVLPEKYKYRVASFKVIQESQIANETKFEAAISVNICSEEGVHQFLSQFQKSSSTNYNILRGDKKDGKTVLISGYRKCLHNVRKRSKSGNQSTDAEVISDTKTHGKQTKCLAQINFT